MLPYQERVVAEKQELDDRIAKLDAFGRTDVWKELPVAEQGRMNRQFAAMEDYSKALSERIAAFQAE